MIARGSGSWMVAGLVLAVLGAVTAFADERPPAINQLQGVVLLPDGQPAAGVPVLMARPTKAYFYLSNSALNVGGEHERVLNYFFKRNARSWCEAITDEAGRFTLVNFAAPDEAWNVAAGTADAGVALKTGVRPSAYAQTPLKIEIPKPAYVSTTVPRMKNCRTYLSVTVAREHDTAAGVEPDATSVETMYVSGDWSSRAKSGPVRIGPLPGGNRYRFTVSASSSSLPYSATVFAREVMVAPGADETVSLEGSDGATVTGRLVSTADEPLAKVNVTVETVDGVVLGAITDDDGKYELRGVPPGAHQFKLLRHIKRTVPG